MENHPIPQDITGFQFKLIGSMTVRQFVYVAVVVIIGWFIAFLLPIPDIISWPISIVLVTLGIIFAFVPVDGRPMDTMLANLIHAMLSPTQYVYGKQGGDISKASEKQPEPKNNPAKTQPVITLPGPTQPQTQTTPNQPLMQTVEVTQQASQPAPIQPVAAPIAPSPIQPTPEQINAAAATQAENDAIVSQERMQAEQAERKIDEETALLERQIEASKTLEQNTPGNQDVANQKIAELERMLAEATRQREALEHEVLKINAKLAGHTQPAVIPAPPQAVDSQNPAPSPTQEPRVKQVAPAQAKSAGVPAMPEAPNLITGIVKDPRGNPLQNILVEVKDEEDNPVRAFKTNGLGRFASATSVSNGKYFLTFEDPKEENKFDTVQIEATGHPIMPLEVTSVDKREELRRELFN